PYLTLAEYVGYLSPLQPVRPRVKRAMPTTARENDGFIQHPARVNNVGRRLDCFLYGSRCGCQARGAKRAHKLKGVKGWQVLCRAAASLADASGWYDWVMDSRFREWRGRHGLQTGTAPATGRLDHFADRHCGGSDGIDEPGSNADVGVHRH